MVHRANLVELVLLVATSGTGCVAGPLALGYLFRLSGFPGLISNFGRDVYYNILKDL